MPLVKYVIFDFFEDFWSFWCDSVTVGRYVCHLSHMYNAMYESLDILCITESNKKIQQRVVNGGWANSSSKAFGVSVADRP
jgi:hypothetical protein